MGLSDADIRDLTVGWLETQTAAQATVLARGGYTWSLIPGQDNANASPLMLTPGNCAATVRRACAPTSPWLTAPLLLGLTPGTPAAPLPRLAAELAAFQLMRGPYAYVGYGVWGMSWPAGSSWDNRNSTLPIPPELGVDYGVPMVRAPPRQCVWGDGILRACGLRVARRSHRQCRPRSARRARASASRAPPACSRVRGRSAT